MNKRGPRGPRHVSRTGGKPGDGVVGGTYDAATNAFVAAMTVAPSTGRKGVIDTLIKGLKTDGIWTKLDHLFLMACHDAQAGLVNAITPSNVATRNGTTTFTADSGFAGDGSTGYIDWGRPYAFTGSNFTQNSATIGCWCTAQATTTNVGVMGDAATPIATTMNIRADGLSEGVRVNASANVTPRTSSNKVGHRTHLRTDATSYHNYLNGTGDLSASSASTTPSTANVWVLGFNTVHVCTDTIGITYSGGALTATDVNNLHSRLNTYLGALAGNP